MGVQTFQFQKEGCVRKDNSYFRFFFFKLNDSNSYGGIKQFLPSIFKILQK